MKSRNALVIIIVLALIAFACTLADAIPAPINAPQSPTAFACEMPPMRFQAIVDNAGPGFAVEGGDWGTCRAGECGGVPHGPDFRYADPGCTFCRARFDLQVQYLCTYDLYAWWPQGEDRATDTPFTITSGGGSMTIKMDQRSDGSRWYLLKTLALKAGDSVSVTVAGSATGYANADAIALTMAAAGPPVAFTFDSFNLLADGDLARD